MIAKKKNCSITLRTHERTEGGAIRHALRIRTYLARFKCKQQPLASAVRMSVASAPVDVCQTWALIMLTVHVPMQRKNSLRLVLCPPTRVGVVVALAAQPAGEHVSPYLPLRS